jgi:Domain of unknown function (DUF4865)
MIAKQYTIQLPADYDMEIIRNRVRDRGAAFDDFPGLGLKAFLITEKDRGASGNCYAPFYLWNDVAGTNEFLYGDGLAGIIESFGRPFVEYWLGADIRIGDTTTDPRSATRQDVAVPNVDLAAVREAGRSWLQACAEDDRGLYAAAVALDPRHWELVRFALWRSPVNEIKPTPEHTVYEMLHLSRPGLYGD